MYIFNFIHLPMKMELIEGYETSAISIVTPGNYPKENILHTEHGESLKSRMYVFVYEKIIEYYLYKTTSNILFNLTCSRFTLKIFVLTEHFLFFFQVRWSKIMRSIGHSLAV